MFAYQELFLRILSYLSPTDLVSIQPVSRYWSRMAVDQQVSLTCLSRISTDPSFGNDYIWVRALLELGRCVTAKSSPLSPSASLTATISDKCLKWLIHTTTLETDSQAPVKSLSASVTYTYAFAIPLSARSLGLNNSFRSLGGSWTFAPLAPFNRGEENTSQGSSSPFGIAGCRPVLRDRIGGAERWCRLEDDDASRNELVSLLSQSAPPQTKGQVKWKCTVTYVCDTATFSIAITFAIPS